MNAEQLEPNKVEPILQRAKSSDLDTMVAVARKTIDRCYRYFLDNQMVGRYLSSERLDHYLGKNIENSWIVSLDSDLVGFSLCIENIIDFMLIDVDFHRQGLGTRLLQHCEATLFEDHQVIALESYEKNTDATQFCVANDWEIANKGIDSNTDLAKLIFRKRQYSETGLLRQQALRPNPVM